MQCANTTTLENKSENYYKYNYLFYNTQIIC